MSNDNSNTTPTWKIIWNYCCDKFEDNSRFAYEHPYYSYFVVFVLSLWIVMIYRLLEQGSSVSSVFNLKNSPFLNKRQRESLSVLTKVSKSGVKNIKNIIEKIKNLFR